MTSSAGDAQPTVADEAGCPKAPERRPNRIHWALNLQPWRGPSSRLVQSSKSNGSSSSPFAKGSWVRLSVNCYQTDGTLLPGKTIEVVINSSLVPTGLLEILHDVQVNLRSDSLQVLLITFLGQPCRNEQTLVLNQVGSFFNLPPAKTKELARGSELFQDLGDPLGEESCVFYGSSTICSVVQCNIGDFRFVTVVAREDVYQETALLRMGLGEGIFLAMDPGYFEDAWNDAAPMMNVGSSSPHWNQSELVRLVHIRVVCAFLHLLTQNLNHAVSDDENRHLSQVAAMMDAPVFSEISTAKEAEKHIKKWKRIQHSLFQHRISLSRAEKHLTRKSPNSDDRMLKIARDVFARYRSSLEAGTMYEEKIKEWIQIDVASLSLRESEISFQQGIQVNMLTRLAFVFIPLTFVTGVFGMNIKPFNNGAPMWQFWVSVITIGIGTFALWRVVVSLSNRRRMRVA